MKRNLSLWQFAGFSLSTLLGTLLHFLYDWSGKNIATAPISGVNESTWEHMKLLFFPLFLFALIQSCFFKEYPHFWCIKLRGILTGLIAIPVLFYTYNGVFGKSPDWVNISIFFVAAAIAFLKEWKLFRQHTSPCRHEKVALLTLCLIGGLFILFTFLTPPIPLFQDPLTGNYGIS